MRPGLSDNSVIAHKNRCNSNDDCQSNICWDADADLLGRYHLGWCGCATDAQCGDTAVWDCEDADLGTGGVQGVCRKKCTTSADCAESATCSDPGGDTQKTCAGRCSAPCSAKSCTTDADCLRGSCESNVCTNCGSSACSQHGEAYTDTMAAMSLNQVEAYHSMLAQAEALGANAPIMVFGAVPNIGDFELVCNDVARADGLIGAGATDDLEVRLGALHNAGDFLRHNRAVMLADPTLPHVVDMMRWWDRDRSTTEQWLTDGLHLAPAGAVWAGGIIRDYLASIGTCSVLDDGERRIPQRYCRQPDNDWRSPDETCTAAADCGTVGDSCALRACTTGADCPDAGDDCAVVP